MIWISFLKKILWILVLNEMILMFIHNIVTLSLELAQDETYILLKVCHGCGNFNRFCVFSGLNLFL